MTGSDLASMPLGQLEQWAENNGIQKYRARQLFRWFHAKGIYDYSRMTDLSRDFRRLLEEQYPLSLPRIVEVRKASDGTHKFRFRLEDGLEIEGVWMPEERRRTLCVSTQVGCAMGCRFCATASMGLVRNLKVSEIMGQLHAVSAFLSQKGMDRPVTNVVFIGMGEPLANMERVATAVGIMLHPLGAGLSRRHITVSTAGLVPAMPKLMERVPVKLAVSLNAANDEIRSSIMPINDKWPLVRLIECCRSLELKHTDRITFEYVMLKGVNDSDDDAIRLAKLLSGISCKVNLIPYNESENSGFERPEPERVERFQQLLIQRNFSVFVRKSRGAELAAGCGQLVTDGARNTG
ncbi:MAG: 23S rRNA (adenine(2503)-C(2))-methyltransferase RlmN [Deltaproteobacteria bacterium]|nr:MAG: 23S rRNA (adenine(2503)-C(2))-methyltransferase RlmN [Deltaproteobacteria bacterium]